MDTGSLDSDEIYSRLDPHGLLARIGGLPEQMERAWISASALELPEEYRSAERIVVLGMGGSAIGGALLRGLTVDLGAPTPVDIVRGYRLPAFVGRRTLVVASSNSGNTEETAAGFGAAIDAGAMCVAITTGGRIGGMASAANVPALTFSWDAEPRSALGWSFASLLAICDKLGLVPGVGADLPNALAEMRTMASEIGRAVPEASNHAKQLARRLASPRPVVICAEALAPVAYRWRTQTNENAKSWAIADELPEMNHNAPVGYGLPRAVVPQLHAVLLRHTSAHPRIGLRFEATVDQMRRAGVSAEMVEISGGSLLAEMLRALMLGDYVSYYLGLLNGVEPSPVVALDELKAQLAARL
jgi:glucose/mannose-6-phosphate isomerase